MKASLAEMDGVLLLLLALTRLAGVVSVEVLDDWALPTVVQKGDKVDLRCNYKLEGENMYSLKWYRDQVGTTHNTVLSSKPDFSNLLFF